MKKYLVNVSLIIVFCCFLDAAFASKESDSIVVLSGDIGGTNARLRLTRLSDGKRDILANESYKVADYKNIYEPLNVFFSTHKVVVSDIDGLCFAVANLMKNDKSEIVIPPWSCFDTEQLKNTLDIDNVKLINDYVAVGYGIESLAEKDLYILQEGEVEKNGLKAFVGVGTGFGVSFSFRYGDQLVVHPSEGGSVGFIPTDRIEADILEGLRHEYNAAVIPAWCLLSGSGIEYIYEYFRTVNPFNYVENEQLRSLISESSREKSVEIVDFVLRHKDDQMSKTTLDRFVKIYGMKSQDIAYTLLPYGGLYVVGSIAASILTKHPYSEIFINNFKDELSEGFPVYVVLNTEVGLQGAEDCAFNMVLSRRTRMNNHHEDEL